jgi:opacity protein-like surface antigen
MKKKHRVLKTALLSSVIGLSLWAAADASKHPAKDLTGALNNLKGFYVGLGLGSGSMKGNMNVSNKAGMHTGRANATASDTSPALNLSLGYEKKFDDYVFGVEANYLYTRLSAAINNSFSNAGADIFSTRTTLKMNNTYGLNFSFGKQFDRITPYAKVGLVSTEFTITSRSSGINPANPAADFNGTQRKRVFGLATGIGMKYAMTERIDFVTEGMAHFYQSFKTNNFSTTAGDSNTAKVDPWFFMFLMGLNWKF